MVDRAKRSPGGRPERADGPDYRTVGAKVPASLLDLVKQPVKTPEFPTLKARVVKLLEDGLDSFEKGPNRLGVIYPGKRKYLGPVDLPLPLGDRFMALIPGENSAAEAVFPFPSITDCLIELLHRGLAQERTQAQQSSIEVSIQPELPLAPTGT
ncbi:hypothetical protein ACQP2U_43105 (plasmid) [Nocardia sp. CA-084685]|uniref:hypothetical protein n=1 Tax=Nocardia sp. CA-084685 TaxID=3239970 RepID=UPI003D95DD51